MLTKALILLFGILAALLSMLLRSPSPDSQKTNGKASQLPSKKNLLIAAGSFVVVTVAGSVITLAIEYGFFASNGVHESPSSTAEEVQTLSEERAPRRPHEPVITNPTEEATERAAVAITERDFNTALGHADTALNLLQNAPSDSRSLHAAHFYRGKALYGLERYEEALDEYDALVDLAPNYPKGKLNYGATLTRLRRFQEAEEWFSAMVSSNPSDADAWNNLAEAHHHQGEYPEAVNAQREAVSLLPRDAELWLNYGLILFWAKRCEESLEAYKAVLRINEHPPAVYYRYLGQTHFCLEDYASAADAFDQAIDKGDTEIKSWVNLTRAQFALRRLEEAAKSARRCTQIDPDSADCWANLGMVQSALGDKLTAAQSYRKALSLDRQRLDLIREACKNIEAALQENESVSAKELCREIQRLIPSSADNPLTCPE